MKLYQVIIINLINFAIFIVFSWSFTHIHLDSLYTWVFWWGMIACYVVMFTTFYIYRRKQTKPNQIETK